MTPPTELVITLPLPPNIANARYQGHWRSKKRKRDAYLEECLTLCLLKRAHLDWKTLGSMADRRASLAFTLHLGAQMDHDNALSRCKWPVDFLVAQGWLHDDSPKWCSMSIPSQVITRDKSKQRLEITIKYEDLNGQVP